MSVSDSTSCPKCKESVSKDASVCPSCRAELGHCSWCHALTTLAEHESNGTSISRHTHTCDRCGREGVKCRARTMGGYCNGLARAGRQLCATCRATVVDSAKTVASWTLIGLVGRKIRPGR